MAIKNKKCLSCQTAFSYCPDCSRVDALKPSYFSEFCSSDCKTLWSTATKFNMGKLTKPEAKAIISALALKPAEQYVSCIQRDLKNIMFEEPKAEPKVKLQPKRTKKSELKLPEPVVAPTIIEEVTSVVEPVPAEKIAPVAATSHEVIYKTEENK